MGWETVLFKIPREKEHDKISLHHHWICPKCSGDQFTIPYKDLFARKGTIQLPTDEKEYRVLTCDRCGLIVAFDGCSGSCMKEPRSKCEVCGKYFCRHCGIAEDFETDGGLVVMRYCNDHIPEWYRNR